MATYVMSDIHGDRKRFHRMLEILRFSPEDTLYILGDVLDRGPEGAELLEDIRREKNMILLLGNHEYMCLRYHAPDADERAIRHWNRNGNAPTLSGLARMGEARKQTLLTYMAGLPSHLDIQVDGRQFYLVHGFPGNTVYEEVWQRPDPDAANPMPGYTVVIGHTPVPCLGRSDAEADRLLEQMAREGRGVSIFHGDGFIDLDCLCGYAEYPAGRLGCLRLEDMAEFYC